MTPPGRLKPQGFFLDVPLSPLPRAPEVFSCPKHLFRPKTHEVSPGALLLKKQPQKAVLSQRSKWAWETSGREAGQWGFCTGCWPISERGQSCQQGSSCPPGHLGSQELWCLASLCPCLARMGFRVKCYTVQHLWKSGGGHRAGSWDLGSRSAPPACGLPFLSPVVPTHTVSFCQTEWHQGWQSPCLLGSSQLQKCGSRPGVCCSREVTVANSRAHRSF